MKKDNKIVSWYKLAETSKWLMAVHIFFGIIRSIGLIVSPIFAAKVTVAIVAGDYKSAWINLAIELAVVFVTFIAFDQVYRNAGRLFTDTYKRVQKKIYKKAYRAEETNFKHTSKEKLLNIIGTDIDVIAVFPDTLGVRISRAVQVLITLVIVFMSNVIVGSAILLLSVVNYFVLLAINKQIAKHKAKMYENKDKIYENFSQVLTNQDIIKQYDMGTKVAKDYFEQTEKYSKSFCKNKNATSIRDNFFYLFYKTVIFAITCFMVLLVQNGTITAETYFVLVPYILTSVELINEIINITSSIEETSISTKRINTILSFTDEDFIAFGKVSHHRQDSKLLLINVSYKSKFADTNSFQNLEDITMKFAYSEINIVKGDRNCGKRSIFGLISRRIVPDKGAVLLDDINLLEYNKDSYRSFIFNAYGKPKFLDETIMNNLSLTNASTERIYEVCKELNIYDYIMQLSNKFDTDVHSSEISKLNYFVLGIAMALLTNSKILTIYELPDGLNTKDVKTIKAILSRLAKSHTIILFTHENRYDDIAKLVYTIKDGKVATCEEKENF